MLEYAFFDSRPRDRFVEFLRARNLAPTLKDDAECLLVQLGEGMEEDVEDAIEDFYDEMMDVDRRLQEAGDEPGFQAAGIVLQLASGESCYATVDPDLLGRIMGVVSAAEFATLVEAIVSAVENPDDRSMCQRMRDADQSADG